MHIALSVTEGQDDQLIFAQQLGIEQVVVEMSDWSTVDLSSRLAGVRNRVTQSGLKLAAVSDLSLSGTRTDSEVLSCIEQAGIDVVSCRLGQPTAAPRRVPVGRGEAMVGQKLYDHVRIDLLDGIQEAVKESGVRLALVADAATGIEIAESARGMAIGVDLNLSASEPEQVARLADTGRIYLVQIGNWTNSPQIPQQAFLDEGDRSVPMMMRALLSVGFDGPVRAAQPPGMVGDTAWGHKGRAFDAGYLKAVLQTLR